MCYYSDMATWSFVGAKHNGLDIMYNNARILWALANMNIVDFNLEKIDSVQSINVQRVFSQDKAHRKDHGACKKWGVLLHDECCVHHGRCRPRSQLWINMIQILFTVIDFQIVVSSDHHNNFQNWTCYVGSNILNLNIDMFEKCMIEYLSLHVP